MKHLLIDLKECADGDIRGRITLPDDSVFVFEALAEVIQKFSESCEVPVFEIVKDIEKFLESNKG